MSARSVRAFTAVAAVVAVSLLPAATTAQLPTPPADVADVIDIATGLTQPLYVCSPPGDTTRLFIVQQNGIILVKVGAAAPTTFLNVSARLNSASGEQGLLGLVFAPDYAATGAFYINYTAPGGGASGQTVVARYFRNSVNPNIADNVETRLLLINQPFSNHNGGCMHFGPDGLLYIGTGDGGSGNDPNNSALNTSDLLGKLLRIDPAIDGFPADPNRNYGIPAGNPFAISGGAPEVWAFGLRNPWRWCFDRANGDLYIADVGQGLTEEINYVPGNGGASPVRNYGWRLREGNARPSGFANDWTAYGTTQAAWQATTTPGNTFGSDYLATLTGPVYTYAHGTGALQGNSVTGGYVYRGRQVRAWHGRYFFADFVRPRLFSGVVSGGVWGSFLDVYSILNPPGPATSISSISSFGEDAAGELYIVQYGSGASGRVRKVVPVYDPLDVNYDTVVNPDDLGDFITAYYQNDIRTDWDFNGSLNPDDLGDFITEYYTP
ncbi:MAG: PQQ-dependent sugar dehydrogenase [Phycisphaerales bacterium]